MASAHRDGRRLLSPRGRWRACIALLLACSGCVYTRLPNLRGQVLDAVSHAPIAGATIEVSGRNDAVETVFTDSNGRFVLRGGTGDGGWPGRTPTFRIRVLADCYAPLDMQGPFGPYNDRVPPTLSALLMERQC